MNEPVETIVHGDAVIEIHHDTNPENPRERDNLGTMVCFHGRYNLGDKTSLKSSDFESWNDFRFYICRKLDAAVVLPLYMMDHSGLTIRTNPEMFRMCDGDRWDWGQIGFIYVDKAKVRKEYSKRRITKDVLERATRCLEGEVETYNMFLGGYVYGYVIKRDGADYDSCWGFYGFDYCVQQAKELIDCAARG